MSSPKPWKKRSVKIVKSNDRAVRGLSRDPWDFVE